MITMLMLVMMHLGYMMVQNQQLTMMLPWSRVIGVMEKVVLAALPRPQVQQWLWYLHLYLFLPPPLQLLCLPYQYVECGQWLIPVVFLPLLHMLCLACLQAR